MVFRGRFSLLGHNNSYSSFPKKILTSHYLPSFVSSEFLNRSSALCKISQSSFRFQNFWTLHIKILRSKCLIPLSILKYLSHFRTRCNHKFLLQHYNRLIFSQDSVRQYSIISKITRLHSIISLENGTWCFTHESYPVCSLRQGEPPLRYRFLSLTANFLTSTVQFSQFPIFSDSLCHQNSALLPLDSHLDKRLELKLLLPFSSFTPFPSWSTFPPVIRLNLLTTYDI